MVCYITRERVRNEYVVITWLRPMDPNAGRCRSLPLPLYSLGDVLDPVCFIREIQFRPWLTRHYVCY
jgi:hypothetical protein